MWCKKNKKIEIVEEIKEPISWLSATEIKVINNRTDKEYIFKSINEFGLMTDWSKDNSLLTIRQITNINQGWNAVAHLKDFSIISFDIKKFKEEIK